MFSAGIGVLNMAKQTALEILGINESMGANNQFWLLDKSVWFYSYKIYSGITYKFVFVNSNHATCFTGKAFFSTFT